MAIPQIPDWRERILRGVGVPATQENLRFMDAWAKAEGGVAVNNPFNTTLNTPGSWALRGNTAGVQQYNSAQAGIDATVNTITNGRYGNIIGALRQGDSAVQAAKALAASPWGTGDLVVKMLGGSSSPSGGVAGAAAPTPQPPTTSPGTMGGTTGGAPTAPQEDPARTFRTNVHNLLNQNIINPATVRLMANLGDATKAVVEARLRPEMPLIQNEPIPRTLTTLQTGSTEGPYKQLDLAADFDGPIHPNANPLINMARQYLGTPYLWGGADPRKGFDCSGFVQYLYAQAGIALGRTTYDQVKQGKAIHEVGALMPGDVVFFSDAGDVHHEGLYIGGGQFIHAPSTGDVVKISSLSEPYYANQFFVGRRFIAPGDPPKPK